VGRDPTEILRSAVMVLVMSDDAAEVEKMRKAFMARMGADADKARDTVLGGSVAQIQDKLGRLRDAGVGMLFIPSFFLPADKKKALDRFITEVAPALR
jgi:alkanesulfonate monooxygenase SsuD/methylene tetrahydromethanopterin reductase-like flavin-dependent oxidoreductase (luciferase family)